MSKSLERALPNTALTERILWLNAMGHGATAISQATGHSREHISFVINHPDAQPIRARAIELQMEKLEPVISRLRHRYSELHGRASDVIEEALAAETPNGFPDWPVRLSALKILVGSRANAFIFGGVADDGDNVPKVGATINLNFTRGPGGEVILLDEVDIEDAEVVTDGTDR